MKLSDIKNKTVDVAVTYFDDTINLKVLANFLTPELESKLHILSETDEGATSPEANTEKVETFALVISSLIKAWDIEDALPTQAILIELGIPFMTATFTAIQERLLPGKKPESN